MSKLYWKTLRDFWRSGSDNGTVDASADAEVNENHPLPVQLAWRDEGVTEYGLVDPTHPLPVTVASAPLIPEYGTMTAVQQAVEIDCSGKASVSVLLTGTWAGTITPEVSLDGQRWVATAFLNKDSDAVADTVTAAGSYLIMHVAGVLKARVRVSAYTSGTVEATLLGTDAPDGVSFLASISTGAGGLGKAEDAAHASGDVGVYVLAVRDDALAAHSGTDGDYESLHTDAVGRLRTVLTPEPDADATATLTTNFGAATKAAAKASAGNLVRFVMINRNAAVRYGQIHNKATAPAATETPIISLPIPGGTTNNPGTLSVELPESQHFTTGIGWAISTTEATFTDSATVGEHSVHLWYV